MYSVVYSALSSSQRSDSLSLSPLIQNLSPPHFSFLSCLPWRSQSGCVRLPPVDLGIHTQSPQELLTAEEEFWEVWLTPYQANPRIVARPDSRDCPEAENDCHCAWLWLVHKLLLRNLLLCLCDLLHCHSHTATPVCFVPYPHLLWIPHQFHPQTLVESVPLVQKAPLSLHPRHHVAHQFFVVCSRVHRLHQRPVPPVDWCLCKFEPLFSQTDPPCSESQLARTWQPLPDLQKEPWLAQAHISKLYCHVLPRSWMNHEIQWSLPDHATCLSCHQWAVDASSTLTVLPQTWFEPVLTYAVLLYGPYHHHPKSWKPS